MIEKNKKKQKKKGGKVVVEDDFIETNDFRDPGTRKKKEKEPTVISFKEEVEIVERSASQRSLTQDNVESSK